MKLCDHGFYLRDCALCEKRPDECDYGSCTRPAVGTITGRHEGVPAPSTAPTSPEPSLTA